MDYFCNECKDHEICKTPENGVGDADCFTPTEANVNTAPSGKAEFALLTIADLKYLKELEGRLCLNGFCWQHHDYLILQNVVPKLNKILKDKYS